MAMSPNGPPASAGVPPHARARRVRAYFWERIPAGALLAVVWALALGAVVLLLGSPNRLGGFSPWQGWTAGPPAYRDVVYSVNQPALGRDVVIAPDDATGERIEWLVATMAAADSSPLLRLNVFTSEAAARRRRELIAAGVYVASDAEEAPDPPEWADVHPAWVGIYTRDPANGVHQLSICLKDPDHSHCAVRRYP